MVLLSLWAASRASAAAAQDSEPVIFELRLDRLRLSDGLVAYLDATGVQLPLAELLAAFELPIRVDPAQGTAEGWLIAENRRFALDVGRREVVVDGRRQPLDPARVVARPEDLYVDHRLLSQWLPIDFEVDLARLLILAQAREELPLQARLERSRRRARIAPRTSHDASRFAVEPVAHRLVDWPFFDSRLDVIYSRREGEPADSTTLYQALLTGDLLAMNAELALRLERRDRATPEVPAERLPSVRFKLERTDVEGRLLGRLRARRVAVGDLLTPKRPLLTAERDARGFEISSFPVDRPAEFDRTTLLGRALPGWEVELYRNRQLIDSQLIGADGLYEFPDVALLYGFNLFRLELYGPHGERRTRIERFLIGPELIRRGETHYRLAAYREEGLTESEEPFAAPFSADGRTADRYLAELERGLSDDLSLRAGLTSLQLADRRHTYLDLGLRGAGRGFFGSLDLIADTAGGWAGRLRAQARYRALHLRFEHDHLSSFRSESITDARDPLSARSAFHLERQLSPGHQPLTLRFAGSREARASGVTLGLDTSFAARWRRLALTGELRRLQSPAGSQTSGALRLSRTASRLALRGSLRYDLTPQATLRDLTLTSDWRWKQRRNLRLRLRRSFADSLPDSLESAFSWHFRRFALGLSASLASDGRSTLGLSLSTSFGRDPLASRWRASAAPIATQGAVAARVFLDRDLDGRFDPRRDEPLANARFSSGARGGKSRTSEAGIAFLTGLPVHEAIDLALATASLEDPFWVPSREGVRFVPRPGRVAAVDFPVVDSAEIDGTVFLRQGGERREVSKVALQLLDPAGEVARETRSGYDGFYLFDKVPPGTYRLRIDPRQVERLRLATPQEPEIHLGGGDVASGVDFELTKEDAAEPRAPGSCC